MIWLACFRIDGDELFMNADNAAGSLLRFTRACDRSRAAWKLRNMLPDATTADAGAVHHEIFWPLAQAPAAADSIETTMTRTRRYMVPTAYHECPQ